MTLRVRNYDLSPKRYKSIFTLRGDPTISLLSMFSSIFCKGQSHLDKIISCLLSRLFVIGAGERSCSKVSSGISSWNFQKVEWLKIKYTAYYYSIWVVFKNKYLPEIFLKINFILTTMDPENSRKSVGSVRCYHKDLRNT